MAPRALLRRGFTLVELMVVFVVIGLLLIAIGPEVGTWMRNIQIRNAADSMQNGLHAARSEAMRRNALVRLTLVGDLTTDCAATASGTAWVVSLDDPASNCDVSESATSAPRIVTKRDALDGSRDVAVTAVRADGSTAATAVVFDGFGRVVGATGIARVDFNNSMPGANYRPLRVTLSASGGVKLCDPSVSASSDDPRRC
jgi:type IV fimbrial biogenesis protein FimT